MIKTYKGFNFIICDKNTKECSGSYFTIIEHDDMIELIMLKDNSFSFIDKEELCFTFEIYLSNGIIFKNIDKIRNGNFNYNLFTTFEKSDNIYSDKFGNVLKFYQNNINDGIFTSNPNIIIKKNKLDEFIDNL